MNVINCLRRRFVRFDKQHRSCYDSDRQRMTSWRLDSWVYGKRGIILFFFSFLYFRINTQFLSSCLQFFPRFIPVKQAALEGLNHIA